MLLTCIHRLWGGLTGVQYNLSKRPGSIDVAMSDPSAHPPSRILAAYTAGSALPTNFHPVHDIVFTAQCSNYPTLTASTPSSPTVALATLFEACASTSSTQTVPITKVTLPAPQSFNLLAQYLYHKRSERLLDSLLPCAAPAGFELNQRRLAPAFMAHLARTFDEARLSSHAELVRSVWANAHEMGVGDEIVWDVLDLAWEVLNGAMALKQESGSESSSDARAASSTA